MPLLTWNSSELVAVLGVIPSQDEFETSYQYLVEQGSLRLQLTVWQYEAHFWSSLRRMHSPDDMMDIR